ncbi:MAG: hypothetical protein ACIAQZ_16500 [Sedimentisphaeraceae bacterium JB056]
MKKAVAVIGALFMFIATWLISGILVALIWEYSRTEVTIGALSTNIAGLIGFILATLAATHTFRASLKTKTGKSDKKIEE